MSEKAENVQRKTLKDLQKAWRTIDQDLFQDYKKFIKKWGLDQDFYTVL